MRAIRKVMNIQEMEDATLWELWITQLQGVVRGSDILRPVDQNNRKWDVKKDTHLGRLKWDSVDHKEHHGCDMRLRSDMKPTKTNQSGQKVFEKTFLVYNEYDSLSAGAAIENMLNIRGKFDGSDPLFLDCKTGKEVTLAT